MSDELEWTLKPDYELHPAGEWRAQFVGWEKDTHEKFGIQVKLTFQTEVLDSDGKHREISTWGKPSLAPKSKVALLMMALKPDFDPKKLTEAELRQFSRVLDDMCGEKLRLQIAHEPKKDAKDEFVDRIKAFLPYRKAAVKTGGFDDDAAESTGDKAAQTQPKQEPVAAGKSSGKAAAKPEEPPVDPFAGED
jgi:hypothetical protein